VAEPSEKGAFGSLSELAKDPYSGVRFHCLEQSNCGAPSPPRFWFGDFDADLAKRYFLGNRPQFPVGVYFTSGLCLSEGYVLQKEGQSLNCPEANFPAVQRESGRVTTHDLCVLPGVHTIIGVGDERGLGGLGIFGHWLVDFLPKIFFLDLCGQDRRSVQLLFLNRIPDYAREMLRLIDIDEKQLTIIENADQRIVKPETLLIPTCCHKGMRFASLFRDYCDQLKACVLAKGGQLSSNRKQRLFIARRSNRRLLVNREQIEALAVKYRFKIVRPETLPLVKQWELFASAGWIVGEYGSALHSSIFSRPGTIVCGLRSKEEPPFYLQSGIGELLGQPTGYVFGRRVDQQQKSFFVDPEHFESCLRLITTKAPFR
jgi:hypothetical protein